MARAASFGFAPYVIFGLLTPLAAGCKSANNQSSSAKGLFSPSDPTIPVYTSPQPLALNEEYIPPQEAAFMQKVGARFHAVHAHQQSLNDKAIPGTGIVWRGMHAKAHGCVNGTLTVNTGDEKYNHGIFQTNGRTYQVVARFSNGNGIISNDNSRDLRGLAVKVLAIDPPFLSQAPRPGTQDLLMTNAPYHHAHDIVELMNFTEASDTGGLTKIDFYVTHIPLVLTLLKQTGRTVESVVSETYWGRSPYSLGSDLTIKFNMVPCTTVQPLYTTASDANRLTKDLDMQFNAAPVCFNVFAQPQLDPKTEPMEDHTVEWMTPAVALGQIVFPQQTPDRGLTCENLVFNPWDGHQDMKPLGNLNRARSPIYGAAEGYRATGATAKGSSDNGPANTSGGVTNSPTYSNDVVDPVNADGTPQSTSGANSQ